MWRACKKRIKSLVDDSGVVQQDSAIMADMVTDYFTNLFTADPALCADQVIDLINARVTGMDVSEKLGNYEGPSNCWCEEISTLRSYA